MRALNVTYLTCGYVHFNTFARCWGKACEWCRCFRVDGSDRTGSCGFIISWRDVDSGPLTDLSNADTFAGSLCAKRRHI
jgi:hypothetical protein